VDKVEQAAEVFWQSSTGCAQLAAPRPKHPSIPPSKSCLTNSGKTCGQRSSVFPSSRTRVLGIPTSGSSPRRNASAVSPGQAPCRSAASSRWRQWARTPGLPPSKR